MLPAVNKVKNIFYFLFFKVRELVLPNRRHITCWRWTSRIPKVPLRRWWDHKITEPAGSSSLSSSPRNSPRLCRVLAAFATDNRTGRLRSCAAPRKNTAKTDNFPRNRFVFGSWGTREQWAALIHWLTHSSDAHMMSSTTMPCNLGRAEPPFLKQTLWILGVFSVMCPR